METNLTLPNNRFIKGSPNLGRQKGCLNKNTRVFQKVFAQTFDELKKDPRTSLLTWAKKHPNDFYRVARKVIPEHTRVFLQSITQNVSDVVSGQ